MRALGEALAVARFDLGESLRSRRALIFLALYVAGAIGATVLFIDVLERIEEQLAEQLLVARTSQPGSLTQAVMESPELRRLLARLVDDDALAGALLGVPPVALVYHWIALTFAPGFVALTSSDAIAGELASGSARYALLRTHRATWVAGKLLGQAALLGVSLALGALGAWLVGWIQLGSFEPGATALHLARYALTAFVFAFAHLGLVLGVSQLTRSRPLARALGLLAVAVAFGGQAWLERSEWRADRPVLFDTLRQLFPAAHRLDLWRPGGGAVAPAALMLVCLGITFLWLGHLRFRGRDL